MPLLAPTLLYAWLWIALLAFRELTLAIVLTTRQNITLPVVVWSLWLNGGLSQASALALVMLLMMMPIVVLYWYVVRRRGILAAGRGGLSHALGPRQALGIDPFRRLAPVHERAQIALPQLAQEHDRAVGAAQAFLAPVLDRALSDLGHVILDRQEIRPVGHVEELHAPGQDGADDLLHRRQRGKLSRLRVAPRAVLGDRLRLQGKRSTMKVL